MRAAQESWIAARTSEAAEGRARVILRLMTRYLAVTIVLVVITLIFLILTATVAPLGQPSGTAAMITRKRIFITLRNAVATWADT